MFVLVAGPRTAERDEDLERMARELRGGAGAARPWRDGARNAAAASVAPSFVPEDAFDVQPIVSEERVFVCQARLDNRTEIEQQLGLGAEMSDSSLLAAAYGRWGHDCVQKLAGDFAFAVWHRHDGRVFAAVDPLGTRRLFWTRVGDAIALSPQLAPLLAHPRVSHEPDLAALARLFDFGIDRPTTPFLAIRALPGGHLLDWRTGEPRVTRWWHPEARASIWYRDSREYVDEARELFTRAVASQLRSSTPLSTTLSGGLDSGAVTATAARLLSSRGVRVTAYTSVPESGLLPSERSGWEADDRGYAQEVAAGFANIDHRLVAPRGRCLLDVVPSIHDLTLTPAKSATNLLWLDAISRLTAESGSRVLLTGQLGNTAFSWRGDGTVWELAMHGRLRGALAQATMEAAARGTSVGRVLAGAIRGRLSRRKVGEGVQLPGMQFLRQDRKPSPRERRNEYVIPAGSRAYWTAFATTPKHVWGPEPTTQWGIEWRDPTADRRLIERLLQYPQAAFRVSGRERGLARELTAGLLPDRVRLRRTQGAQVPEAASLIAQHERCYEAALRAMRDSGPCRELFDVDAIQRALDTLTRGSRDYHLALQLDRAFGIALFLMHLEQRR
jgi:asparagine synthase (glutamine-hydrolysing)